eukprot:TRINITY_DN3134_c0_g1_i7.p1 TRINITY_DN3134_c0_g1~~TRINITY_DN3134_c0_g1_i7.p1  ORF type:complete len:231 (+),score=58.97 TRINITY_DN3134_c0_g1_i7:178-870(+)
MGLQPKKGLRFQDEIDALIDSIDSFDGAENDSGLIHYDRKVDYQEFIKFIMSDLDCAPRGGWEGVHPTTQLLQGKRVVALFFGTSWAPQTLKLQRSLEQFYSRLRSEGDDSFEVVYVSHDQDVAQYENFYKEHPWMAIPFQDREQRHFMEQKLFVTTLPRLVLLDNTGALLSYDAKFEVMDYVDNPKAAMRKWLSQNYISCVADREDKPHQRHTGGSNRLAFISGRNRLL